ncbi:MAG: ribbon-helix-helix protein, CopG family [Bdellovibrionales bacterium]|nr:ribbon-helix-helix protein, CopG family [Bdellovibrionales bacterium]
MLALRLPADIEKRLDDLAKKTGRTKSYYARQAILEKLEDLEDIYLAEERLAKPGRRIPLDEVMAEYADDIAALENDEE